MQRIEQRFPDQGEIAAARRLMESQRIALAAIGGTVLLGGIAVLMINRRF